MPYDPNFPPPSAPLVSAQWRDQFHGLKGLIDAVPAGPQGPQGLPGPANWFVLESDPGGGDGDCWLRPSDGAVFRKESGAWAHFGYIQGPVGPEGPQGPPGEVSQAQLDGAIAGTSNNTNGVAEIDTSGMSDPTDIAIANKLNELILAGRR
jgi:hypothetical protein